MKLDLNKLEELSKKSVIGFLEYDQGMYLRLTPEGKMEYDFYPENVQFIVALHNAFPSILQTLKAYKEAIEKVREMEPCDSFLVDINGEDQTNGYQHADGMWKHQRDSILQDLDKKLSEIE